MTTGLEPSGRLVIADHALPSTVAGHAWRRVLHGIETRAVDQWLDADVPALLDESGLVACEDIRLAGGRVRLIVTGHRD